MRPNRSRRFKNVCGSKVGLDKEENSLPSTSLTEADTVLVLADALDCGAIPAKIASFEGVVGRLSDMLKRFKNEFRVEGLSVYTG